MIPVLVTFLLVLCIILGTYYAFLVVPEQREQGVLLKRLGPSGKVAKTSLGNLERPIQRLSNVRVVNLVLERATGVSRPLDRLVTQSGLKTHRGNAVARLGVHGLCLLPPDQDVHVLDAPRAGRRTTRRDAADHRGAVLPCKRLEKFEEQFPESIELIARALRAGHALPTGLLMVADEMPDPVGGEFKLVYDRQNFGMPLQDALRGLAERIPVLDARFFVTAVLTQRETGGNLSEVLDNLAKVIRDRFRVKRQVRVVSHTDASLAGSLPGCHRHWRACSASCPRIT